MWVNSPGSAWNPIFVTGSVQPSPLGVRQPQQAERYFRLANGPAGPRLADELEELGRAFDREARELESRTGDTSPGRHARRFMEGAVLTCGPNLPRALRRRGREIGRPWPAGAGLSDVRCEWVRAAARIRQGRPAIERPPHVAPPDREEYARLGQVCFVERNRDALLLCEGTHFANVVAGQSLADRAVNRRHCREMRCLGADTSAMKPDAPSLARPIPEMHASCLGNV